MLCSDYTKSEKLKAVTLDIEENKSPKIQFDYPGLSHIIQNKNFSQEASEVREERHNFIVKQILLESSLNERNCSQIVENRPSTLSPT